MLDNFVKVRRGITQHVNEGSLCLTDFAVYIFLLLKADKVNGTLWMSSVLLSGQFGDGSLSPRTAKESLHRLKEAGYIKEFRQQGSRGSYPILINKYEITVGVRKGCVTNAAQTVDWRQPVVSDRPEDVSDDRCEDVREGRREDRPPYSRPQETQDLKTSKAVVPPASEMITTTETPSQVSLPEIDRTVPKEKMALEDVSILDQPHQLTLGLWRAMGSPKHISDNELRTWERHISPLVSEYDFSVLYRAMKHALLTSTYWPKWVTSGEGLARNARKIVDDYLAFKKGEENYKRMKAQEEQKSSVKDNRKAPSRYGNEGVITLAPGESL